MLTGMRAVMLEQISYRVNRSPAEIFRRTRGIWGTVTDRSLGRQLSWLLSNGFVTRHGDASEGFSYLAVRLPVYLPVKPEGAASW